MGEWARTFEKMIFSYLMRYRVYTVANWRNRFECSCTRYELNDVYKVPFDVSENGTIHLYNHFYKSPLRKLRPNERFNHYAFLKPIEKPNFDVPVGTIKAVIDVDG